MKKTIGIILKIILIICILFTAIIGFMVALEFNPEYVENLTLSGNSTKILTKGSNINVVLYDVNYLINDTNDEMLSLTDEISSVLYNVNPVVDGGADIALMHRIYYKSREHANQYREIADKFNGLATYSSNYNAFVTPERKLSKVNMGICSLSRFDFSAQRLWLPETNTFPDVVFSYKPGIIKQTMNIEGQDEKLVVLSCYLYEDNKNQIEYIRKYINDEYESGNYVVFGGTFSSSFKEKLGQVGEGFKIYTLDDTDKMGFVVSPNIPTSSVKKIDTKFASPVNLTIKL